MLEWAKSEPYRTDIFWRDMFMKLLPVEIGAHLTLTHEEALDELERRFPRFIDGKPVRYVEQLRAPHIAGVKAQLLSVRQSSAANHGGSLATTYSWNPLESTGVQL